MLTALKISSRNKTKQKINNNNNNNNPNTLNQCPVNLWPIEARKKTKHMCSSIQAIEKKKAFDKSEPKKTKTRRRRWWSKATGEKQQPHKSESAAFVFDSVIVVYFFSCPLCFTLCLSRRSVLMQQTATILFSNVRHRRLTTFTHLMIVFIF